MSQVSTKELQNRCPQIFLFWLQVKTMRRPIDDQQLR